MEENQSHDSLELSNSPHQNDQTPLEHPENFLLFLKEEEENSQSSPSFFSNNGLSRDILKVTEAEPDICLEAFYALYSTLESQIEKHPTTPLKDAWRNFFGTGVAKGILSSPEKLLGKKKAQDIKEWLSKDEGEVEVFQDLDQVVYFIKQFKRKVLDCLNQVTQKQEIIALIDHVEGFYTGFRMRVIDLAQKSLQKNEYSMINYHALENLLEPKAVMMSSIFPNHWAYRIPRKKAQMMLSLDRSERPVQNYSNELSIHRVAALPEKTEAPEPLVYFKANGIAPIRPEKEFMLDRLYRYLNIPVPETALLILADVFSNKNYFYAVQASEAVTGSSALEASKNSEAMFNEETYVPQVIGAFLTDPSDGSYKNYTYSPRYKTPVRIDNDLIFKPEFTEVKDIRNHKVDRVVNVKSVLYFSPLMDKPVPSSVQTYFSTIDPHLMMLLWLRDLDRQNREYRLLFSKLSYQNARYIFQNLRPQEEKPSLSASLQEKVYVDSDFHRNSFHPQILVSKNLLNTLINKLQKIESTLIKAPSVSPQTLFKETSPILEKYYNRLKLKIQDIKMREFALWGNQIDGVNYSYLSSIFSDEELCSLTQRKGPLGYETSLYEPGEFFGDCKRALISEKTPLDNLVRRHSRRRRGNLLNLQMVLKELKLLIQEDLTDLRYPREAVDFLHDISKISNKSSLGREIKSLISYSPNAELKWLFTIEEYFLRGDIKVPRDLRIFSLPVLGAYMKQRTFIPTEFEKCYLFDQQGNIKKNPSLTGRSNVTYFPEKNPKFYLKQYPEFPGFESASNLLMRLLGIKHLPYQDLIVINEYPVLITQNIEGSPVYKIWGNPQKFKNLDSVHTALLIIAAMLFNPEDGKEDNFILALSLRHIPYIGHAAKKFFSVQQFLIPQKIPFFHHKDQDYH